MPNVLLSGPAGAGKSQEARRLLAEATEPTIVADFSAIMAALTLAERGPDGKYPVRTSRTEALLPIAEYVRRAAISAATERDIAVITTSSDGDPERRAFLLGLLGPGAREILINPGRDVVEARLTDPISGELSEECNQAVNRWFSRVSRK